jgi:hypothetical protein
MPIRKPRYTMQHSISADLPIPVIRWPAGWWSGNKQPYADRDSFPPIEDLRYRKKESMVLASIDFRLALRSAKRLWILDNYFDDKYGADFLADALLDSRLEELRIIGMTNINESQAKQRLEDLLEILELNAEGYVPVVEWRQSSTRESEVAIHDRFAVIDDELWHFGSTVGGAHRSINAYSRGWNATTTGAIEFFNELWKR